MPRLGKELTMETYAAKSEVDFKVVIPQEVYDKVMHWVNKAGNYEVSGMGRVVYDKQESTFRVLDAYLLKQSNQAAHTEIDENALNKLAYQCHREEGTLRWWWHSHAKMPTFFSTTDVATIKDFGGNGMLVATVFNQHYTYKSAVGFQSTRRIISNNYFDGESDEVDNEAEYNDNVETIIERTIPVAVIAEWDKQYDDNVPAPKPYTYTPQFAGAQQYSSSYFDTPDWRKEVEQHKADRQLTMLSNEERKISKDEIKYLIENETGLLGYGIRAEAKALSMSAREYCRKIYFNSNYTETCDLEDRLLVLEQSGAFDEVAKVVYGAN